MAMLSPNYINPRILTCVVSLVSYLWLVRVQRWRRYRAIHAKYQAKFEAGELTPRDAQEVIHLAAFFDMPLLMRYSLALALFKTYGIPSISKLLASTKEFACPLKTSKRYVDTQLLISSWITFPLAGRFGDDKDDTPLDPRGSLALARTNWLHSKYKINNNDYLYTLSLFILEPARRAKQYGWRPLSPMEQEAFFIFWREVGRRMNISEIPDTLEAFAEWSLEYEQQNMVPADTNHEIAAETTEELLFAVPKALGIKNEIRGLTVCLLEDHVRAAMLLPTQPPYRHTLINTILAIVQLVQKYICLPRSQPKIIIKVEVPEAKSGSLPRLYPNRFPSTPWYRPECTGFYYLLDRLMVAVGFYAELPGPQYHSDGYHIEELGPLKYEQEGTSEVMKMAEHLHGHPITGPFSQNPQL